MKTDKKESKSVKIIPLGGLDKIGMNITAIEYEDTIVVVDCGIAFPEGDMLGIDKVIPDVSYLVKNKEKVKGFVITHGHEDHIGALPYILPQLNVPVYATRLTMGLIEHKLKEANLIRKTRRKVVKQGGYVVFRRYAGGIYQDQPQHRRSLCPRHLYAGRRHSPHRRFQSGLYAAFWRTH